MTPRTALPIAWVQTLVLVVAGALGLWMLIGSAQSGPLDIGTILAVLVGWSFVACGTFLWVRRRGRPGPLMVAFGGLWLIGRSLLLIQQPILFTAGMWISDLSAAAFALFLLSFPGGRIASRIDRAIAGIFLFVSIPLEFVWLLFLELEGGLNILAIAPNAAAAQVIDAVQRSSLAFAAVLLVGSVVGRWLRSRGPVRRQMVPVLVGAAAILLASASWILQPLGITLPELNNLVLAAQFAIPIAIVTVLLQATRPGPRDPPAHPHRVRSRGRRGVPGRSIVGRGQGRHRARALHSGRRRRRVLRHLGGPRERRQIRQRDDGSRSGQALRGPHDDRGR